MAFDKTAIETDEACSEFSIFLKDETGQTRSIPTFLGRIVSGWGEGLKED